LRGARCYAGGPHKIAHSCHIGGLDAFGLSKAGNLPVTLYSVSTPSGPTDFMANPAGVIFSSNSFSPMAKIFTCFADCDCALSIYRLASARAKKRQIDVRRGEHSRYPLPEHVLMFYMQYWGDIRLSQCPVSSSDLVFCTPMP
jgi:hypothetical protein